MKIRNCLACLAITLCIVLVPTLNRAAGGAVYVEAEDLTDSDGDHYGEKYFISSTLNESVYVYPRADLRENVNGSVTPGPVPLGPGESHVLIGQFNRANPSKAWSVHVIAKWERQ